MVLEFNLYPDGTWGPRNDSILCNWDPSLPSGPVDNLTDSCPEGLYYDNEFSCCCLEWCWGGGAYPIEWVERFVALPVCVIVFVGGLIGNVLILAMFCTRELSSMVSRVFFQTIAVVDTCVLMTKPLDFILMYMSGQDVVSVYESVATCKLFRYVSLIAGLVSGFCVAFLTIDRFVCVTWPLKANQIRQKHRLAAVAVLFVAAMLLYVPQLIYQNYSPIYGCVPDRYDETYMWYYGAVAPLINLFTLTVIPFSVIIVCNVGIIYAMRKGEGVTSTKSDSAQSRRLSRLFILISMSFIVTTLPHNVFYIYSQNLDGNRTYRAHAQLAMQFIILLSIYYSNYALNFYLYCLMGTRFRVALKSIFGCGRTGRDLTEQS